MTIFLLSLVFPLHVEAVLVLFVALLDDAKMRLRIFGHQAVIWHATKVTFTFVLLHHNLR